MQVLPRVARLTPKAACLHGRALVRRSLVVHAQTNSAVTATASVDATAQQRFPSEPSFQYFLNSANKSNLDSFDAPSQSANSGPGRKVYIETYGCQMNVNDSEVLLSVLADNGYAQTQQDTDADVIFLNTCAIREQAEQRIWSRLAVLKKLKNSNKDRWHTSNATSLGQHTCPVAWLAPVGQSQASICGAGRLLSVCLAAWRRD